jgi:hypothetical protein
LLDADAILLVTPVDRAQRVGAETLMAKRRSLNYPGTSDNLARMARPDVWARELNLKVDGRQFSTVGAEYTIPVMRDTSQKIVVRKAAQTRFTILFLIRSFHWIVERGWQHLYLLPLKQGAIPFVQKRVDPIISSSPYLASRFAAVDNRLHKQTVDDIAILIRGVNVESEMQETPTDVIVYDEYDRMSTQWLGDAKHRTDGSSIKRHTYLSTPTVPGHGLDAEDMWHSSDQHLWEVKCPGCSRFQSFNREENLRIGDNMWDCAVECQFCARAFSDVERVAANATGRWIPQNLEGHFRGYSINQLSSPTMTLPEIMEDFFRGQKDAKVLKAWFNQSMGEPWSADGNQITKEMLDKCREDYLCGGIPASPVSLGVDVGHDDIYVWGDVHDRYGRARLYNIWYFQDDSRLSAWEKLDREVLSKLGTWMCVADAHPDKRGAAALSKKYRGRFWLGFEKDRPDTEMVAAWGKQVYGEPAKVVIDRTMAFDTVIHQVMNGEVVLPMNARELGEEMPRRDYNGMYHHMIQMVRVEEEDTKGRIVARWEKNKNPDHWHHAKMFSFVASLKKPSLRIPGNMANALKNSGNPVAA